MRPLAIDLYCGLGGWTDGLLAEGYDVIGFDIERHAYGDHRYPGQLVIQDVCTIHGSQFKDATLIVASPPCFVSDTIILTARGMLVIQDVVIGDLVLTHRNRWCRVLRTGSTTAPTIIASGYGAVLEGTAEHPIYARRDVGSYRHRVIGQSFPVYQPKCLDQPEWIPLAESAECHWASPVAFASLPVPALPNGLADTLAFWWMVGRWVGDGWLRQGRRSGSEVLICCGHAEADELESRLAAVAPRKGTRAIAGELHWRRSRERTAARFTSRDCGVEGTKNGNDWFGAGENCSLQRRHGSKSGGRKMASAMIAKIPLTLSRHIAATFRQPKLSATADRT